jgi:hypothetical protein
LATAARCKHVDDEGQRCPNKAQAGGFCKKHSPDAGPRPTPAPAAKSTPVEQAGAWARLVYYAGRIADWIKDQDWPNPFDFLSTEQMRIVEAIGKSRSEKSKSRLVAELFASLDAAQWLKLLTVVASLPEQAPRRRKAERATANRK